MQELLTDTVRHNMTSPPKAVAPETTISDLLRLFALDDVDAYPVLSRDELVGIVSKSDVLKLISLRFDRDSSCYDSIMGTTADQIMSHHVVTVGPETTLERLIRSMGNNRLRHLLVTDGAGRLKGMIAHDDLMQALSRRDQRQALPLVAPAVGYAIA